MTHPPKSTAVPQRNVKRFWPILPLAAILFALMLEDLHVMGYSPFEADACGASEADQSSLSAKLYNPLAEWGIHHTGLPQVAIVYIDPTVEPTELLTNTCASRAFLARLVPDLIALGANVIAIDKYYTENACGEKATNDLFKSALDTSRIPIVVGQPTRVLSGSKLAGCLSVVPGFQFSPTSRVMHGLTRLNIDTLKLPLRWPVFSDALPPVSLPQDAGDTLSLVAAKAQAPTLESTAPMPALLASGKHPYTTFIELPNIHAMTVLCSIEKDPRYADGTAIPCDNNKWKQDSHNLDGKSLSLAGKVVVIGDVSELDMQPFPGGERPGVFLQANYIQSLLDQRFLTETPLSVTLVFLVLFVIAVYVLYWAHDKDEQPIFTVEQAGIRSVALLGVLILLSLGGLVAFDFFTPIWALWGAIFFMAFRYLEASGHHRSQHLLGHLASHRAENELHENEGKIVDDRS